tara:strand:- start:7 stop:174 length:168 start_codon:yes stop_codon:yes gene_type:complete
MEFLTIMQKKQFGKLLIAVGIVCLLRANGGKKVVRGQACSTDQTGLIEQAQSHAP